MSITFINRQQKAHAIDWLKATLTLFIMPYTTETMRQRVSEHVAYVEVHTGPLDVACRIETSDIDGTIVITTTIRPLQGAPVEAKVA